MSITKEGDVTKLMMKSQESGGGGSKTASNGNREGEVVRYTHYWQDNTIPCNQEFHRKSDDCVQDKSKMRQLSELGPDCCFILFPLPVCLFVCCLFVVLNSQMPLVQDLWILHVNTQYSDCCTQSQSGW